LRAIHQPITDMPIAGDTNSKRAADRGCAILLGRTGGKRDTERVSRCPWANTELYAAYHDAEWGVPLHDDQRLFEFLVLEGAQAGLSWITILKKRENYRAAFANFVPQKVARYGARDVERLLGNAGIVRNRLKIAAAIQNAKAFLAVQEEFGSFDRYIWRFVDGLPIQNQWRSLAELPARTAESDALSRDLLQRGFKFVGSTICYAHMQATGMVNDHLVSCPRHAELGGKARRK
jgi:DNA-3-methyladenine glycosylase I